MEDDNLDNVAEVAEEATNETQPVAEQKKARSIEELLADSKEDDKDTSDTGDDDAGDSDETGDDSEDEQEEEIEEEQEEVVDETESEELNASFGNLKKEYPDIFKKFPGLRNKLGREYAYSELFPTVDDARSANKKAEVFDYFDRQVAKDPISILSAVPDNQAVKFAENILPALRNANPQLFTKAVDPFVRHMLNKIDKDATAAEDKNLGLAVKYIAGYLYGKKEVPELPVRRANQVDEEKEELRAKVTQAEQREADSFSSSVTSSVQRTLSKEVKALIDPNNTLAQKAQDVWVKQVIEELDEELSNNPTHMARMKAFREKAKDSGFNDSHKTRILSAYLQTARPLLRTISQRIKKEAFGGKKSPDDSNRKEGRKVIPSGSGISKTPSKSLPTGFKDVKQFKIKGGKMEDLLA